MVPNAVVKVPPAAATPGHGFTLTTPRAGGGGIAFTQSGTAGFISGKGAGVHAHAGGRYKSDSVIRISTEGTVIGRGGHGIFAREDRQSGVITVIASGTVVGSGAGSDGIRAQSYHVSGGRLIQVAAADVRGERHGIYTSFFSDGDTIVTVSGSVTGGAGGFGVKVRGVLRGNTHRIILESGAHVSGGSGGIETNHGRVVLRAVHATISGGIDLGDRHSGEDDAVSLRDSVVSGGIETLHGNDVVTIDGGSVSGGISLGDESDTLTISGAEVSGKVDLGNNDDRLIASGATISGNIDLGGNNDRMIVSDSTISGNVDLGGNDDRLYLRESIITGNVNLGKDADTVTLEGGKIFGSLDLGDGDDRVTFGPGFSEVAGGFRGADVSVGQNREQYRVLIESGAVARIGHTRNFGSMTFIDIKPGAIAVLDGLGSFAWLSRIDIGGTLNTADGISGARNAFTKTSMVIARLDGINKMPGTWIFDAYFSGDFNQRFVTGVVDRLFLNHGQPHNWSGPLTLEPAITVGEQGATLDVADGHFGGTFNVGVPEAFSYHDINGAVYIRQDMANGGCTSEGSGVFTCSNLIYSTQTLSTSGETLDVTLNRVGVVHALAGTRRGLVLSQSGTGGIKLTQSAIGARIAAAGHAIHARNTDAGGVSIIVTGTVIGGMTGRVENADGIVAIDGAAGEGVYVSAVDVSGLRHGIVATAAGSGGASVRTTGDVAGKIGNAVVIDGGSGTAAAVIGGALTGGRDGIRGSARGSGAVSISAHGAVTGWRGAGIAIDAGSGNVSVAAGSVHGGSGGIVMNVGGNVSVATSGSVTGKFGTGIAINAGSGIVDLAVGSVYGASDGITVRGSGTASIRVGGRIALTGSGDRRHISVFNSAGSVAASVLLESGASIRGSGTVFRNDAGDSIFTVGHGASVESSGRFEFGAGDDALVVHGAVSASGTLHDAGAGDDTLTVKSGGTASFGRFAGFESVSVEGGGALQVSGSLTLQELSVQGTFSLTDGAASTISVVDDFTGGGTIWFDANFTSVAADKLMIGGDASGVTGIEVTEFGVDPTKTFDIVTVAGAAAENAFRSGSIFLNIERVTGPNDSTTFRLSSVSASGSCTQNGGSGPYTCSGALRAPQAIALPSTVDTVVVMDDTAGLRIPAESGSGSPGFYFSGGGALSFTQSAGGHEITGNSRGIRALISTSLNNKDIDITTTGTVTARTGTGIRAETTSRFGDITLTASEKVVGVSGDGIMAALGGGGGGQVQIAASEVMGSRHGIYVKLPTGSSSIVVSKSASGGPGGVGIAIRGGGPGDVHSITLESGARVIGGSGGIEATGGQVTLSARNATISGDIRLHTSPSAADRVSLVETTVSGGLSTRGGNDVVVIEGGTISGGIDLGAGTDTFRFGRGFSVVTGDIDGEETIAFVDDAVVRIDNAGSMGPSTTLTIESGAIAILDNLAEQKDFERVEILGTLNTADGAITEDPRANSKVFRANSIQGGGTWVLDANLERGYADTFGYRSAGDAYAGGTLTIEPVLLAANLNGRAKFAEHRNHRDVFVPSVPEAFSIEYEEVGDTQAGYIKQIIASGSCASADSGVFTCSNLIFESQLLNAPGEDLIVTLDSTAIVHALAGTRQGLALSKTGDGEVRLTQSVGGGRIAAAGHAIHVSNMDVGSISIVVTGTVIGGLTGRVYAADGIVALNDASGGGVQISASTVTGLRHGIVAKAEGRGEVRVRAGDSVSSRFGMGIYARAAVGALAVTAGSVTGGAAGIKAVGGGTVAVDASGTVAAAGPSVGVGIDLLALGSADLSVTAVTVMGGATGIRVESRGAGAISVKATGAVTGTSTAGVQAIGGSTAGAIAINVATVSGGTGILARQAGTSALDISATGPVTGTAMGIDALTSSAGTLAITAASVTGGAIGIRAKSGGAGTISVHAAGLVKGTGVAGVQAIGGSTTGAIAINVATVTGATGILARRAGASALDIAVIGSVVATGSDGVGIDALASSAGALAITAAAVTGVAAGIRAVGSGTGDVAVNASGTVEATAPSTGVGIDLLAVGGADLSVTAAAVTGGATGIRAESRGSGTISVTATGLVTGTASAGVRAIGGSATGAMSINVATVTGKRGIVAGKNGAGALRIAAVGKVTGTAADGILAWTGVSGGSLTVTVARVTATGGGSGISAIGSGTGAVSVFATGTVESKNDGIYAKTGASGGALTVSASFVNTGLGGSDRKSGSAAVRAIADGTGAVSVNVGLLQNNLAESGFGIDIKSSGGDVTVITPGTATARGTAIRVEARSGGGDVSITTSGRVAGGFAGSSGHGIFVDNDGSGKTSISVSGSVRATAGDGVAIKTDAASGRKVTIALNHGANVGTDRNRSAIVDGAGDSLVTLNSGATLRGKVDLGSGADRIEVFGGSSIDSSEISGGGGSDRLSFRNFSARFPGAALTGWETVEVGAGSSVSFGSGAHSMTVDSLAVTGTLDVGRDTDTLDTLTLTGDFAGGGTVALNANFVTGVPDRFVIVGGVSGTTAVRISPLGTLGPGKTAYDRPSRIDGVIKVQGQGDLSSGTFTADVVDLGRVLYRFEFDAENRQFNLVRFAATHNYCEETSVGSGVFICNGTSTIFDPQHLGASGTTALQVTLHPETPADSSGTAFALSQTGGTGGIAFTQSANGQTIKGSANAIFASNTGGGAISIDVNGKVTGASKFGIFAIDDDQGAGITITAASVEGKMIGINAFASGTGGVSVMATTVSGGVGIIVSNTGGGAISIGASGAITGSSGYGISAIDDAQGAGITIDVATVTGSTAAIRAVGSGTGGVSVSASTVSGGIGITLSNTGGGAISITASGAVTGSSGYGIYAIDDAQGASITINAGAVRGSTAAIRAVGSGTGGVSVSASTVSGGIGINVSNTGGGAISITGSGAVTGSSGYGILATNKAQGTGIAINAGAVSGATTAIKATGSGTGDISVTATGTVTGSGAAAAGIQATGGNTVGAIAINVATVTGGTGILARHSGAGNIAILAAGALMGTGQDGAGIDLETSGGVLTITAQSVTGAAAGIRAVGGGVAVNVGGTVVATAASTGVGIDLRASGDSGLSVTAASVTGSAAGIRAMSNGAGAVSIRAIGSVAGSGTDGVGIDALTSSVGALAVTAAAVSGGAVGIRAVGSGTGAVAVDASGTVVATRPSVGVGIDLLATGGANLSVTAAEVMGGAIGIRAVGSGAGTISVKATGKVTGTGTAGVRTIGGSKTGAIAINVATVTGATGILARQAGAGKLSIVVTGTVAGTGTDGAGIDALTSSAGGLSITAASATGVAAGIRAVGSGAGAVAVDASGTVVATGAAGVGIDLRATSGTGLSVVSASVTGGGIGIRAVSSGAASISVTATGLVTGTASAGIRAIGGTSAGAMSINVATVTGKHGIVAGQNGVGALRIAAIGKVTGTAADGILAWSGVSGGDLTVTVANVAATGGGSGIRAIGSGTGAVSVFATGTVESSKDGIYAKTGASGGSLTVSGLYVNAGQGPSQGRKSGSAVIRAIADGTGAVSINVHVAQNNFTNSGLGLDIKSSGGDVTITAGTVSAIETAIRVEARSGGGDVSITTSDRVEGGFLNAPSGHGIFVDNDGSGTTSISVSGSVYAAGESSAIKTDAASGSKVTIALNHGAKVGEDRSGRAIVGGAGDSLVMLNSGATLRGEVDLGAGTDRIEVFGGSSIDSSKIAGGAGSDRLSFRNFSGRFPGAALTGWETVEVGTGSSVSFGTGGHAVTAGSLAVSGTLDVGRDSDTLDTLTLTGDFAGGGTVALNVNFVTGIADKLVITGSVSGTTVLDISGLGALGPGQTPYARPERIEDVVKVTSGSVTETAFTASEVAFGWIVYRLDLGQDGAFDLVRHVASNSCIENSQGSGVFTCSGTDTIVLTQSLSATGDTSLVVTLNSETPVDSRGTAFLLTQTNGSGGIQFTQSASGLAIKAAQDGIFATNDGGGAISITVNGSVTGGAVGIRAVDSGAGTIFVGATGSVTGAAAGISAVASGTGAVAVNASGTVEATAASTGVGIDLLATSGADLSVTAASVTGGATGIRAESRGAGTISVTATGLVTGPAFAGIYAIGGSATGAMSINVATVTGKRGIVAGQSGAGALRIAATGKVTGTAADGILAWSGVSGGSLTVTVARVTATGGGSGIRAIGSGTGAVSVFATGTVESKNDGIYAKTGASGGALTVSASFINVGLGETADRKSGSAAVRAIADGTGAVSVNVGLLQNNLAEGGLGIDIKSSGGDVTVTTARTANARGTAIRVEARSGGGDVSITTLGGVAGGFAGSSGHGIFVDNDGSGKTSISVSGSVRATVGDGIAIKTDAASGRKVTIALNHGATVGTDRNRSAIVDGAGDSLVTLNSGATLRGKVDLGLGADRIEVFGGSSIDSSEISGGGGSDRLSFRNFSGRFPGAILTGWETVEVGAGSSVSFGSGAHSLTVGSLAVTGTLDVGRDTDTLDTLTLTGDFAGGGTVALNANFAAGGSDRLKISGNVAGTTVLNISRLGALGPGQTHDDRPERIDDVITVTAGNVTQTSFTASEIVYGWFSYKLVFNEVDRSFDLVRTSVDSNGCVETSAGSGVFHLQRRRRHHLAAVAQRDRRHVACCHAEFRNPGRNSERRLHADADRRHRRHPVHPVGQRPCDQGGAKRNRCLQRRRWGDIDRCQRIGDRRKRKRDLRERNRTAAP